MLVLPEFAVVMVVVSIISVQFVDRYGIAFQYLNPEAIDGGAVNTTSQVLYTYRETSVEEGNIYELGSFEDFPVYPPDPRQQISVTQVPSSPQLATASLCFTMVGLPNTLDYPFSIQVSGTVLYNTTVLSVGASPKYGCLFPTGSGDYLCNQQYVQILGWTGTHTITNRFGTQYTVPFTLQPAGQVFSNNWLYLNAPYWDYDGLTSKFPYVTQFPGGQYGDQFSLFTTSGDPNAQAFYPTEGMATDNINPHDINNDYTQTVISSSVLQFQPSVYNPSLATNPNGAPVTGTTSGVCTTPTLNLVPNIPPPSITAATLTYSFTGTPTASQTASGHFAYTVSANINLLLDGTVNVDGLGNYYYTIIGASGTRTYQTTADSAPLTVYITGVLPVGALNGGDYPNNNRLFPQFPYIDASGIGFALDYPVPADGFPLSYVSATTNISIWMYRSTQLKEGFGNNLNGLSSSGFTNGLTDSPPNIQLVVQSQYTPVTRTAPSIPSTFFNPQGPTITNGYFCNILVGAPGTVDYPWTSYTWAQFNYNLGSLPSTYQVQNITNGVRVFNNRYGNSFSDPISVVSSLTPNFIYTTGLPLDVNGLSYYLAYPMQLPGNSPLLQDQEITLSYTNTSLLQEGRSNVINKTASIFLSNIVSSKSAYYISINSISSAAACAALVPSFPIQTALPVISKLQARTASFVYTTTDQATFNASATIKVSLRVDSNAFPLPLTDSIGNIYYTIASVLTLGSSRSYLYGTYPTYSSSTAQSYAVTGAGVSSFFCTTLPGDQLVYQAPPYLDSQGITYQTTVNLPIAGTPGPATTNVFTVYAGPNGVLQENPQRETVSTFSTGQFFP